MVEWATLAFPKAKTCREIGYFHKIQMIRACFEPKPLQAAIYGSCLWGGILAFFALTSCGISTRATK